VGNRDLSARDRGVDRLAAGDRDGASAAGVMLVTVPVPPPPADGAQYVTSASLTVSPTVWATLVSVTSTSATAGRFDPT